MMNLSLDVHGHDDGATMAVAGEVDRHGAGRLLERSLGAVREHGPWLTIDLAGVTFMDCGGVEVLLTIRCRSHLMGGQLWMISPSAPVRRVFGILGLDAVLAPPGRPETDENVTTCEEW
jgi:anti-anti-sigma factor